MIRSYTMGLGLWSPGLDKGIWCPVCFQYFQNHQIRYTYKATSKWVVSLVIAGSHSNLTQGVCMGTFGSIYSLSPPLRCRL